MYANVRAARGRFQSTRPSRASTTALGSFLLPCIFQSTRPSRASTVSSKAISSFDIFQSTRPSRASTNGQQGKSYKAEISIHKALTGLDDSLGIPRFPMHISIHKALTGLDHLLIRHSIAVRHFNPQGPHGPRPSCIVDPSKRTGISIHKALTGLDKAVPVGQATCSISIHKALTGLDMSGPVSLFPDRYFNPQGPHGPRPAFPGTARAL